VATNVGSGFANIADLRFGPNGALYASDFGNDRIYRFVPPTVPGAQTTVYARVTDPQKLTFAPDGTLFAGRDNSGSGGGNADSVKVHRIAPGGASVTEFGTSAIPDPDAVVFDAAGTVSGVAGSVIVGGVWSGSSGALSGIAPDQSVVKFFGPVGWVVNPTDLIFDETGRLLFTDIEGGKVFTMTNATPIALFSLSLPLDIAVDALDRIIVSSRADSVLRLYSADGAPVNLALALAQPNTPLVRGPGGFWGNEVYFVSTNGNLHCVATNGAVRTVGAGFGGLEDFAFGPDGALYASHFENDLIWRIAPTDERPRLTIVPTRNFASLTWPSVTNRSYQLQSTTNLALADWLAEGSPTAGTGGPLTNTLPIGSELGKFFRLHLMGN
jgi:sugar lactone lactonase YvrE